MCYLPRLAVAAPASKYPVRATLVVARTHCAPGFDEAGQNPAYGRATVG